MQDLRIEIGHTYVYTVLRYVFLSTYLLMYANYCIYKSKATYTYLRVNFQMTTYDSLIAK